MSEAAVRSLATSVITASILAGVNNTFFKPEAAEAANKATTIGDHISNVVADIPGAIQQGVVNGAISGAVDTAINGGDLGENLLGSIQGAVVSEIGASAATEIGVAYHNGDINKAAQYIAHAALGGAMDKALGGDGVSGAVGAVVGEAAGELLANEIKEALLTGDITEDQARAWQERGVPLARLAAGLVAAVWGLDVMMAANAGGNAAENNALSALKALLTRVVLRREVTAAEKEKDGIMLDVSICVYEVTCHAVGDFKEVEDKTIPGVDLSKFVDVQSGLVSRLFYNEKTNEYVFAFKGTDMTQTNDWVTNITQATVGGGAQYEQAGAAGQLRKLSDYVKSQGATLVATGHSLGGGLATAVASTGYFDRAVVFNPAGLNVLTPGKIGGAMDNAARVTKAYVSDIDLLNVAQDVLLSPISQARGEIVYVKNGGLHFLDDLKTAFQ